MRKTISMYWPLAIVVPLAAAAYLYLSEAAPRRAPAVGAARDGAPPGAAG